MQKHFQVTWLLRLIKNIYEYIYYILQGIHILINSSIFISTRPLSIQTFINVFTANTRSTHLARLACTAYLLALHIPPLRLVCLRFQENMKNYVMPVRLLWLVLSMPMPLRVFVIATTTTWRHFILNVNVIICQIFYVTLTHTQTHTDGKGQGGEHTYSLTYLESSVKSRLVCFLFLAAMSECQ